MVALAAWQGLLSVMGHILAWLFDLVGNYGVAIILLTIAIRFVLFPLGYRQIKSMQAMQAIQPKVKEIQKKYKGNRQKQQEETMKLYNQYGVSPLGGCLPLLLQFPILITVYQLIRPPQLVPHTEGTQAVVTYYTVHNNHLPIDSTLFHDVLTGTGVNFITLDLQCSAIQAGTNAKLLAGRTPIVGNVPIYNSDGTKLPFNALSRSTNDCGGSPLAKAPYILLALGMMGTTYYQQKQMQRASPPSAQNQQQQAILKVMPLMFGIFGLLWPSGLLVYWFTSNVWQIGQQSALLRAGHIGPDALERRKKELESRPPKKGFMARMNERMEQQQQTRKEPGQKPEPPRRRPPGSGSGRRSGPSTGKPRPGGSGQGGSGQGGSGQGKKKPGGSGGTGSGKGRPKR